MVLGELVTGRFEWGPGSRPRGSDMGQLVTNSRFSVANPYSSQIRSTGPNGSFLFFEEKQWIVHKPRHECGSGCPRHPCTRVLAASGPIHLQTVTPMVPWGGCEPIGRPTFEPLGLKWAVRAFVALYHSLPTRALGLSAAGRVPQGDGTVVACACLSNGWGDGMRPLWRSQSRGGRFAFRFLRL
jgi:hypothetical protein